jgi:hypothetical protein
VSSSASTTGIGLRLNVKNKRPAVIVQHLI